jgi:hypothetical protein
MPDDVKLPDSRSFHASDYVRRIVPPWDETNTPKVEFRGSAFGNYTNPMSTADTRAVFTYGLALCDEIDNPPRLWETGALYASSGTPMFVYRREPNGWQSLWNDDRAFFADDNSAISEHWLSSLVKLVPEVA